MKRVTVKEDYNFYKERALRWRSREQYYANQIAEFGFAGCVRVYGLDGKKLDWFECYDRREHAYNCYKKNLNKLKNEFTKEFEADEEF